MRWEWPRRAAMRRKVQWRPWFAWYPVRIAGEVVWLERIERQGHYVYGPAVGYAWWNYEYRRPEDES